MVKSDSTGSELLTHSQLASYFREKEQKVQGKFTPPLLTQVKRFEMDKLIGMENSKAISYLTQVFSSKEQLSSINFMKDVQIPRIISNTQQSVVASKDPPSKVFKHRRLIVHPEIDHEKRALFLRDLEKYKKWKERSEKVRKRYVIRESRTEEEIEAERKVQAMIMNKRQGKPIHAKEQNSEDES